MKSYPLRPKSYSLANPKWILLSVLICSTIFNLSATVTVDINSGNPNFPFPQFLPYSDGESHNLGNLATHNAPGLTHAEMEQTIRDAWQIMANRFIYTGDEYQGVEYIKSNEGRITSYNVCYTKLLRCVLVSHVIILIHKKQKTGSTDC